MLVLTCLSLIYVSTIAHNRFLYPPPRTTWDDRRHMKEQTGACGGDDYSLGNITQLEAGSTIEIIITEPIHHPGQPWRIALSHPNDEQFDCILLNHIPAHSFGTAKEFLRVPITIPDIECIGCTLQLLQISTTENNLNQCCRFEPYQTCPRDLYYSCANIDIINGNGNRDDLICRQPPNWTYRNLACNYYNYYEESDQVWEEVNDNELRLIVDTEFPLDDEDEACPRDLLAYMDTSCNDPISDGSAEETTNGLQST
eukprot:CAMPEP_0201565398 /NCGR_PEP_ID=MMETSP0190_2-20130828/4502_1 /ASSEMBLY_ACC=CAM_ASM_000263 /TAXON_ID=37353 /ORGANISM="Rosalina sp." /LENGTH=255 /DNA_ID=CAMNT_0047982841 /DNA_START=1 /DNA_END=765 /DNA_ORIENTATION=-